MYLRRILFSFVLLSGATLFVLPFSASAFDFCVAAASSSSTTCPGASTSSSACKNSSGSDLCVPGQVSPGMYEHCCQSAVDPCAIGSSSAGTCLSSQTKINSCGGLQSVCVTSSALTAPPTAAACATTPPPPGCTATPPTGSTVTTTVKNPLAFSTVEEVLGSLLGALQGIIVVLSLVFILVGAFFYITSAGDDGRMKTAKGAITASMIGLALGLAAPSFLKQIGTILGRGPVNGAAVASAKTLSDIVLSVLQFLLSIVGVLGIIMLVVGGIVYITASGDEDRIDTGKKIVKYAIIGIAIALVALIVVSQIANFFVA